MNTQKPSILASQVIWKSFIVILLALLAFQSFGTNSLAAPAAPSFDFQEGEDNRQALACSPSEIAVEPTYCDIQIVLLIDDSGSMRTNDPQKSPAGGLRNQGAKNLVDVLATQYYLPAAQLQADNPAVELPDVQVAVIHFSANVKKQSEGWISINPGSLEDWEKQRVELYELIDWKNSYSTKQYTHFVEPFEIAAELFASSADEGDCVRRSILLFTDGTPEDRQGRLQGEELDAEMEMVNSIVQPGLSELDVSIYVTGFKVNRDYWTNVEPYWSEIVGTSSQDEALPRSVLLEGVDALIQMASRMEEIAASLIDVQSLALNPDAQDPLSYSIDIPKHVQSLRLTLYNLDPEAGLRITDPNGNEVISDGQNVNSSGETTSVEVWQLNTPLAGSYKVQASKRGGIIRQLLTYQNLAVERDSEPGSLYVSEPGEIKFKLVDSSGEAVLPGDDPAYSLDLKVFVTQAEQEEELEWAQEGDGYLVSWTPSSEGDSQFTIEANLVNIDGDPLWNCGGTLAELPVDRRPSVVKPPSLVIFPPVACAPPDDPIALPVQLEYEGDRAWATSLGWTVSAAAMPGGQKVNASVTALDATNGEYELRIDPIKAVDTVEKIQLTVSAQAEIDGQPIDISDGKTHTIDVCPININGCVECDGVWRFWFWPLVIALLALMLILLALRFRPEPAERYHQEERQDKFRTGAWHLLFWPVLILLTLLILNKLLWCCIIPPWLFLALILILLIVLLLVWFYPQDGHSRRRSGWLVVLLLLLVLIWYFLFSAQWIFLLWLLLILFFLIWIIRWYRTRRRPDSWWWFLILVIFVVSIWFILFGSLPAWLILIWLLMWLFILLLGWVIWHYVEWRRSLRFWLLVLFGFALAIIWLVYFGAYWIYLFWMLLLALLLIWVIARSRRDPETDFSWWLLILVTLFVSIWFILVGGFPFWLILLLLLMWAGILTLAWIFSRDIERKRSYQPWLVLAFLLILALTSFIFFSGTWVAIFLWLVVIVVLTWVILWLISPVPGPDDLTLIEGIGPKVEAFLNEQGITTFRQLANTDIDQLNDWLNERDWDYMDPKTWPYQAGLADLAKVSGKKGDQDEFEKYKAWLKSGIDPDEYRRAEIERSKDLRKPPEEDNKND